MFPSHDTHAPAISPKSIPFTLIKPIELRQHQLEALDILLKQDTSYSKLLGMPPGYGKTIAFLNYLTKVNHLACAVMKPNYAQQWLKVIPTVLDIAREEILYLEGTKSILDAHKKLKEDKFNYKFILISNRSLQQYIKPTKQDKYSIPFHQFLAQAGVGSLLIDEVHEDLHFNYMLMCSVNVQRVIGLSGTCSSHSS